MAIEEQTLTHIGIGGLFALAILKETYAFLKTQKNNKNGNTLVLVSRAELDKHTGLLQSKDTCGEIVKRFDGRFDSIDSSLKEVKTLIKNGN